jgi:hypothetical protein
MSCSRSRCCSRRERDARNVNGGAVTIAKPDPESRMRNPDQSAFGNVVGSGLAPSSQVDIGSQ